MLFSSHRLRSIVFEAGIALIIFLSDPLGLTEQKHRAIDAGLAVATQYLRPGPSPKLAVLLIDQPTLDDWKVDWPIAYGKTAELIHALACARAAGMFFDFTAGRKFNLVEGGGNLKQVVEDSSADGTICADGKPPSKIPVFFGKVAGARSPLSEWFAQRDASFFLNAGEADGIYQTGSEKFPSRPLRLDEVSPAFGIIRAVPSLRPAPASENDAPCGEHDARPRCWTAPLAIVWSARLDPQQPQVSDVIKCRGDRGLLHILWGLTQFGADERYESCPPVLTLSGIDLSRDLNFIERFGDPAKALTGRFVFVGANLAGLNDRVATPLHDHLPGVYKHAVALSALLHYGARYPTLPAPVTLGAIAAVIYLVLEAVRELTRHRPNEYMSFPSALCVCIVAFSAVVYWRSWPASLIVAVFGYYGGVVSALFFAEKAKRRSSTETFRAVPMRKGQRTCTHG